MSGSFAKWLTFRGKRFSSSSEPHLISPLLTHSHNQSSRVFIASVLPCSAVAPMVRMLGHLFIYLATTRSYLKIWVHEGYLTSSAKQKARLESREIGTNTLACFPDASRGTQRSIVHVYIGASRNDNKTSSSACYYHLEPIVQATLLPSLISQPRGSHVAW